MKSFNNALLTLTFLGMSIASFQQTLQTEQILEAINNTGERSGFFSKSIIKALPEQVQTDEDYIVGSSYYLVATEPPKTTVETVQQIDYEMGKQTTNTKLSHPQLQLPKPSAPEHDEYKHKRKKRPTCQDDNIPVIYIDQQTVVHLGTIMPITQPLRRAA